MFKFDELTSRTCVLIFADLRTGWYALEIAVCLQAMDVSFILWNFNMIDQWVFMQTQIKKISNIIYQTLNLFFFSFLFWRGINVIID